MQASNTSGRIGSLLMNPGGPGGSGIDFLRRTASRYFKNLNARFDLVSWDPRGVGASTPVTCLDGPQLDRFLALDSVIDDPQEESDFIKANRDFAIACTRKSGDLLPYVDSESTARDMDQIRAAIGDPRLTYLGFSYGTEIGQWYAHLFPTHVRALALDGVVDVAANTRASLLAPLEAFQRNLQAFLADCRSRPACEFGSSGDPGEKLTAAMAKLDATPLAVGNRELTRSLAMDAVLASMYNQNSWPKLQLALGAFDRGDGSGLLAIADSWNERNADGTYTNFANGAFASIRCIDGFRPPTQIGPEDPYGPAIEKASPFFGPWLEWDGIYCEYWPELPKPYQQLTISGAPPILLIGATNDPATPYVWAQSVSRQISRSVLLTRVGNGHTSYGFSACIDGAEDAYLIDLTLPATGTTCNN
jgi:pimeloyl-ACP methyl ester carboxylesterase